MPAHPRYLPIIILLISGLFLASCSSVSAQAGSQDPVQAPITADRITIVAEGMFVPNQWGYLSFARSGQVAEILVDEGDLVHAGDVIARLGNREQTEAAVADAELNASSAELEVAMAEVELLSAQQALDTIYDDWPADFAAAQQALKDANQRVYDAERQIGYLTSEPSQSTIDIAYSNMVLAEAALEKAENDFAPHAAKPATNITRAHFQTRLAEAQDAYDQALRTYNNLVGSTSEFQLSQGDMELAIAQTELKVARVEYDLLENGPDPDEISAAESRIVAAEASLETAKERIKAAQASLAAAKADLNNLDLVATTDGTILEMNLIVGQQVNPGEQLVLLADYSKWFVETDNLTEFEVVDVDVGQKVLLAPDALPDLELNGTISSISDTYAQVQDSVTYTARIMLDDVDPRLRWGMTVVVTFIE